MTHSSRTVNPLRQRFIEDMTARKLSGKTQPSYIRAVRRFAQYLRRSPDTATAEDLRCYQLHLVNQGIASGNLNTNLTALRFFYRHTLDRGNVVRKLRGVPEPQRVPVVLSQSEVQRLIAATPKLKYRTIFSVAYGAGLRVGEVVALKVNDIDSQRMTLRIQQGKGQKDRYALLSPAMLKILRSWWKEAHAQGKISSLGRHYAVRYSLTREDIDKVRRGIAVLGEMMLAAGADYVEPGVYGWDSQVSDRTRMASFATDGPTDPRAYMMAVTHMFGTCRMGSDPRRSVVGPDFRHHHVPSLYVADSSVFPSNTGVNPQTILTGRVMRSRR